MSLVYKMYDIHEAKERAGRAVIAAKIRQNVFARSKRRDNEDDRAAAQREDSQKKTIFSVELI